MKAIKQKNKTYKKKIANYNMELGVKPEGHIQFKLNISELCGGVADPFKDLPKTPKEKMN